MASTVKRGRPRKIVVEDGPGRLKEIEAPLELPDQESDPKNHRIWYLASELLKSKAKDHSNLSQVAIVELANYAKILNEEIYGQAG